MAARQYRKSDILRAYAALGWGRARDAEPADAAGLVTYAERVAEWQHEEVHATHWMAHLWDNVALWTALMVHYQEHWGPTEDAGTETDWSLTAAHVWPRPPESPA